jgi:hypothetical protein
VGPAQTSPVTYPPLNQPSPRRGWFIVLGAAVLGVLVFCGIVVAAAGSKKPDDTRDVARTGAFTMQTTAAPATTGTSPTATGAATATPTPAATTAPATTAAPATKAPTTKPPTKQPTTRPPTKQPTTRPPAGNCNPNYSPCVPNDPVDVDCKGGSGNGPSYVQGPVRVIGSDVYKLDADHDGIACE